jgi:hypothetical protein
VYIPRRDSDSHLTSIVGGRLFSGPHARATFTVAESDDRFDVRLRSADDRTQVAVCGSVTSSLPSASVFANLAEASEFFRGGSVGYSATARPGLYDGLELRVAEWRVEPLSVEHVSSSFFDDPRTFRVSHPSELTPATRRRLVIACYVVGTVLRSQRASRARRPAAL